MSKFCVRGPLHHIPSLGRQWGMHGELIRAGNNHITKQFQCCNLLLVSQYWFPDNIVSLWIALASKTIRAAISPCLSDWHNSHSLIMELLQRGWRRRPWYDDIWLLETWPRRCDFLDEVWHIGYADLGLDYWLTPCQTLPTPWTPARHNRIIRRVHFMLVETQFIKFSLC